MADRNCIVKTAREILWINLLETQCDCSARSLLRGRASSDASCYDDRLRTADATTASPEEPRPTTAATVASTPNESRTRGGRRCRLGFRAGVENRQPCALLFLPDVPSVVST